MAGPPMFRRAITLAIVRLGLDFTAVRQMLGRVRLQRDFLRPLPGWNREAAVEIGFQTNSGT